MKCPNCGNEAEVDYNAVFCGFCGARIYGKEPKNAELARPGKTKMRKIFAIISIALIIFTVPVCVIFLGDPEWLPIGIISSGLAIVAAVLSKKIILIILSALSLLGVCAEIFILIWL